MARPIEGEAAGRTGDGQAPLWRRRRDQPVSRGATTFEKYPDGSENKEYLVLRAAHSFAAHPTAQAGESDPLYTGHYEFLQSDVNYRAPLTTPQPLIHGLQTAKVVGKDGEEIDVDEHGRILVRFYWDRKNKQSCRVRVAQVWAGKGWGGQVIPRIGMEVIVEFLEGDPDRPLVTGAVYNADYKYPYEMPANKTQSGLKSDSSKGHGGYNEFMFEDKKGSEEIRMHAEKDHNVVIRHAETVEIGENFQGMDPSRTTTLKNGSDSSRFSSAARPLRSSRTRPSRWTLAIRPSISIWAAKPRRRCSQLR